MLMPGIFGENLFVDNWMDFPFDRNFFGRQNSAYGKMEKPVMKTDIMETADSYELDIDLPGFKKEEIQAHLEKGYLTITASKSADADQKSGSGKYIRRERYTGSLSRSFYVGDYLTEQDVRAKFENGILKLSIPKKDAKAVQQKRCISIDG